MNRRKEYQRYRVLIAASVAVLVATIALLIMQVKSLRRTEIQSKATLEANLDLRLLEVVENAKWDILDHANHVFHSIRQQRIRERNLPSIERAFTRASKRYPETDDFYVVFFDPKEEQNTWNAYHFIPPDLNDPKVQRFNGSTVGKLVENPEVSESLLRAWTTVEKRDQAALYTAFDPIGNNESKSRQYFFHTVYELDRLNRADPLERIGLMVFSASVEKFPSSNYLAKLLEKHSKQEKPSQEFLGDLSYSVEKREGQFSRTLVGVKDTAIRKRGFEVSERLFPDVTFGMATQNFISNSFFEESTNLGILLGFSAASLLIIGLLLTWWSIRREMKLAQMKSDFLANISHELKTPITAIRAFGDLIHSGRTNSAERLKAYGGLIKTESDRLTSLINNVLEYSRLEKGIQSYRMEIGDIRSVVCETVELFKHIPEASGFDFELKLPPSSVNATFNKSSIRQSLINLLSNAVKYSDAAIASDNAIVTVTVLNLETKVVIEVADSGIGIAASEQREIFKSFHRSSNSAIQDKSGIGLGLAIVNAIVKAHGGKLTVKSEIGIGSTFRIELPVSQLSSEQVVKPISMVEGSVNGSHLGN